MSNKKPWTMADLEAEICRQERTEREDRKNRIAAAWKIIEAQDAKVAAWNRGEAR